VLFSCAGFAHEGGIKGHIQDSLSGNKLTGITVQVQDSKLMTSTDFLGNFNFPEMKAGTYLLKISGLGYETESLTITVEEQKTTTITVYMLPGSYNLSEITITQDQGNSKTFQDINKLDIGLRPMRSSQDVLRLIPGLVIAQHAGGGKAEQIFLRGFDIDHGTDIRLSVDDMPVNMVSHAHGQGYADLHFLTPELIDNVNFNKGMYYANQGDFTTAGYANFNTKNYLDQSSVKLETGMFNTYRTLGMFDLLGTAGKQKNQSAYISSEYMYTNGYFESPQHFNRINLFGKYHGAIAKDKVLDVTASTFSSKWEASGQIPERAVEEGLITRFGSIDNKEGGQTSRSNINMKLVQQLDNDAVIKNQLFFVNYNFLLFSNFTFFLNDSINGDQIKQNESRNIYGYNGSYSKNQHLGANKLTSEVGMQLRYDDVNNIGLSHTKQRKTTLDQLALGQINQFNGAVYLDETFKVADKFTVNAAIRYDHFQFEYVNDLDSNYNRQTQTKGIASPKLSLFYNAASNLQLYLKGGTGFHSNDTRVVVAQSGQKILPRAYGGDLGLIAKPAKNLWISAAAWIIDLEQEFVYVGDEAVVEAGGYTRRYGTDLSLRYQVLKWLFIDSDLNYTVPRTLHVEKGESYIPLAPTFTSIGGITTIFQNGLQASLRYRCVGDRAANEMNTVTAKGYTILDAVVNFKRPKYAIGLSAENLLNTQWNEAQFDTESRLKNEAAPVSELHFTPGTPFFLKGSVTYYF
jgi:hypothetical protein